MHSGNIAADDNDNVKLSRHFDWFYGAFYGAEFEIIFRCVVTELLKIGISRKLEFLKLHAIPMFSIIFLFYFFFLLFLYICLSVCRRISKALTPYNNHHLYLPPTTTCLICNITMTHFHFVSLAPKINLKIRPPRTNISFGTRNFHFTIVVHLILCQIRKSLFLFN